MVCKKHIWQKYGRCRGKQRYKCKICNKTSYEKDDNYMKQILDLILSFINNYSFKEYIWDKVVTYNENGEINEAYDAYRYKIIKETVSWKEFSKNINKMPSLNQPMAIFLCEPDIDALDWKEKTLRIFEVYK